jgi:hypothetical protein
MIYLSARDPSWLLKEPKPEAFQTIKIFSKNTDVIDCLFDCLHAVFGSMITHLTK